MASATVVHSIEIPESPEVVWARFKDFKGFAEWNVNHVAFPDGTPDLGPEAEYREQLQVRGAPGEVHWTVSDYEEDRRAVLEGQGPVKIKLHQEFSVESAGEGSKFTFLLEFSGPIKPMVTAISKEVDRNVAESVSKFSELGSGTDG